MRFIHTSDWHLGRILDQFHLTEDQAYVLDQMTTLAKDEKAEAFLISGDIYDRAVPPPEAVELLSDFVSHVTLDLKIPIIVIAGNHDSRERLGFGAKILQRGQLYMFGPAMPQTPYIDLEDAHGTVRFYCLPYAEPAEWREVLGEGSIRDHNAGYQRYIRDIRAAHPKGMRSVLLTHCFVAGGEKTDSERPLMIGGGGVVDPGLFDSFDYSALGHLHRPQRISRAQYSGSILKYSASEAGHEKSVCVVEMNEAGACKVEARMFSPRRDLRVVEGLFDDISKGMPSEDYVHVILRDKQPILDAAGRLRRVYPNLLGVERPEERLGDGRTEATAMAKLSEDELFQVFFERVSGEKPEESIVQVFRDAVAAVRGSEGEALS